MKNSLPQSGAMMNFSFGLLVVMLVALTIFTWLLLTKLNRLKKYVKKEKMDIAATILSIVIVAMCIGGIIVYLFCMSAMAR